MFYKALQFLKFLIINSTNQHGVHSPFIYHFVTKGLYASKIKNKIIPLDGNNLTKKETILLLKIYNYFNIETLAVATNLKITTTPKKIVFLNSIDTLHTYNLKDYNTLNFIIVRDIYKSKQVFKKWQKIIHSTDGIVTVNVFYFGIIFFRKQQAKEHFNIRVL